MAYSKMYTTNYLPPKCANGELNISSPGKFAQVIQFYPCWRGFESKEASWSGLSINDEISYKVLGVINDRSFLKLAIRLIPSVNG